MSVFFFRRLVFMLIMFLPGLCTSQMALGCVMVYQWVSSVISLWTTTCKEGTAFISKSFIFSAVQQYKQYIFPPDSCSKPWKFRLPVLLKMAFSFFFHNLSLQEPSFPFCYDLLVIHLILLKQNPTFGLFFRHYQLEFWAWESVTS